MLETLRSMIKEEWRIHSTMFGSFMFALFPVLVAVIAFVGTFLTQAFSFILTANQMILLVHYAFLLFGIITGGFGLLGREIMNRRFGSVSLITYSSRTLPISLKNIFANFIVKDIFYYFILWILPIVAGFFFASLFLSINLIYSAIFLLTLTLSFMIGVSVIFLLTTIYAHSIKLLVGLLVATTIIILFTVNFSLGFLGLLPSYILFITPSVENLLITLVIIVVFSAISLNFLKVDFPEKKKKYKNMLNVLIKTFWFSKQSVFMSKDLLDMQRSEGGFGKIIFSFIFPVVLVWILIYVFIRFFIQINLFILFCILLGAISSTIYNWLTEFEVFTSYSFLPVRVSTIIKSKINSYILLDLISLVFIFLAMITIGKLEFLPVSLVSFASISAYMLAVTIYFTGLHPNILIYNAKVFAQYIASAMPVLMVIILLSVFNPSYLFASIVLIPFSFWLIQKSYNKWESWE